MPQTLNDRPDGASEAAIPKKTLIHLLRSGEESVYKRVIALLLFIGLLVLFRHLVLLGVTFVVFAHSLRFLGARVARLLGQPERRGTVLVLLLFGLLLGLGLWASVHLGGRWFQRFFLMHQGVSLPKVFQDMYEDLLRRLPEWLPIEGIKEQVPHVVQPVVDYLRATGRVLMEVLIGLILAVIYVLDREPVDQLLRGLPQDTVAGAVRRYFGYLGEAILITISLQVLVALVNTLLTLPVLVVLRLPHVIAFSAVIFFSSLVPVVGNLVSGAVLIVASYLYQGLWAVSFFLVTTFILHKIEAYYLNPRLAARHVNLPSLILIISLILHEHVFGLVGLFMSFPVLYIGLNVLRDLRGEMPLDTTAPPVAVVAVAPAPAAAAGTPAEPPVTPPPAV